MSGFNFTPPLGWQAPYIGIPWQFDGYSHAGLSCWGLCCQAWSDVAQVHLPSFANQLPQDHTFTTDRIRLVNALIKDEINIMTPLTTPRPMCLVQMRKGQHLTHIGLYAFGGWIVHACEDEGRVVQDRLETLKHSITAYLWPSDAILEAT